jgi:DMSO reductase anchor subunit
MMAIDLAGRPLVGLLTAICAVVGVMCSARIYMVRARPAWDTHYTLAGFLATGVLLGPLFVRAMGVSDAPWTVWVAASGGAMQLLAETLKFLYLSC